MSKPKVLEGSFYPLGDSKLCCTPAFWLWPVCHMRSSVAYSARGVMSALRTFQIGNIWDFSFSEEGHSLNFYMKPVLILTAWTYAIITACFIIEEMKAQRDKKLTQGTGCELTWNGASLRPGWGTVPGARASLVRKGGAFFKKLTIKLRRCNQAGVILWWLWEDTPASYPRLGSRKYPDPARNLLCSTRKTRHCLWFWSHSF